jgi:predicted RNase H-like HicB family nuclease
MATVLRSRAVFADEAMKNPVVVEIVEAEGDVTPQFSFELEADRTEVLVAAEPDGFVPEQILERYIATALRRVLGETMEDGRFFVSIPALGDVWAEGATADEAMNELEDVVRQWVLMKIEDQDHDIPVLETLDLNRL